jgi:hypothetical protein
MKILEVDHAISACKSHLKTSKSNNTEIEFFLTRYLLILWAAQCEKEFKNILKNNIKCTHGNQKLNKYLESSLFDTYRGIKVSGMTDFLKLLGEEYSDEWTKKCKQKTISRAINSWGILINERHDTAHVSGSNITFNDFVNHYEKCHIILDVVRDIIKK